MNEINKRIRAIEKRIESIKPAEVEPEADQPADSGCKCAPIGRRSSSAPRNGLLSLLVSALTGIAP